MNTKTHVITFINEKGGVGKTSSCFNIAWQAAGLGKRILLIDLDGQNANLTFFCGVAKPDTIKTIYDVLFMGYPLKDAIIPVRKNIDILPASQNVAVMPQQSKVGRFRKELETVEKDYDYIFIDVNPIPNQSHALALGAADSCIIPMLPDITSLQGNMGVAESIEEIRYSGNSGLKVLGLLFNKYDPRTNLSKEVTRKAEEMAKALNTKVFDTRIRNAVAMSECVYAHQGITDYDPASKAAEDIRNLTKEIIKEAEKEV